MNCVIPPHMLEYIIRHGKPAQRKRAFKALTLSGQMRGRRQSLFQVEFPVVSTALTHKHRLIYSAGFGSELPGELVRSEGNSPKGDAAVDEAYDGAGNASAVDPIYDCYGTEKK